MTANNQPFRYAYDSESDKYGYIRKVNGADTFFPFSSGEMHFKSHYGGNNARITIELDCEPENFIIIYQSPDINTNPLENTVTSGAYMPFEIWFIKNDTKLICPATRNMELNGNMLTFTILSSASVYTNIIYG